MRKNVIRKLCAGILCFGLLFSTLVSAAEYTDIAASEYAPSIRLLSALGILTGQDEQTFAPESNITRAEFAATLCRLRPSIGTQAAPSAFADVPVDHWAADEIGEISRLQIMNGTDEGLFLPEQNITLNEAVKTLVVMAGYGPLASLQGGYPSGYLAIANSKKMLKGVSAQGNTPITRAAAAKLLDNMLQSPALEVGEFGVNITYQESDLHTNFYSFLGIEKAIGLVEATEVTSLSMPTSGTKNAVIIDGVLYDAGDTDAGQYLGMTVDYYYEYDEREPQTLRFVQPSDVKNASLTMDADNILSYENRVYRYESSKDDTKGTKAYLAEDFRLIYNGRAYTGMFTADLMKPLDGVVRLVDYNGDASYDVVFVESYETIVVGGFDADNEIIYDRNDPAKRVLVSSSASSLPVVIKNPDGNAFPLDKLAKNNIASVMRNGEYISVIVSQQQIFGTLEEYGTDGDIPWYQVGGTVYQPTNAYRKAGLPDVHLGDNLTLYLNHNGKIAHIDINTGASAIGFLAQKKLEKSGIDAGVQLRIFTADGELKDMKANEIRWNGAAVKQDAVKVYEEIPTYTLVTYRENGEGKITDLSVPVSKEQAKDGELFLRAAGNYHVYKSKARTFGGQENLMGDSVIFSVPTEKDVADTDQYQILGITDLLDAKYYTYDAYGVTKDRLTAQYILMVGQGGSEITGDTGFSIVTRVTKVVDDENETYKLTLLSSNGESSVIAKEPALVTHNSATPLGKTISIDEGDIVRCTLNSKGRATAIEIAYDLETNTFVDHTDGTRYDTKMRTMFGYVGDIENTVFQLVNLAEDANGKPLADAVPEVLELCTTDGAKIYVYDSEKRKDKVRTGSYTDLLSYRQAGSHCTKVFVHLRAGVPQTIVVYK